MSYNDEKYNEFQRRCIMEMHAILHASDNKNLTMSALYDWCKIFVDDYESMEYYRKELEVK